MITDEQKQGITKSLDDFCKKKGSANKAAIKLQVSGATISHISNLNWDSINDNMWRTIAAGTGYTNNVWEIVKTKGFKQMTAFLSDAKNYSNVHAFVANAGSGKTEAIKAYTQNNKNVYHLNCSEFWTKRYFFKQLLQEIGIDPGGYTLPEMMDACVDALKKIDDPVIVFDEVDKLKDPLIYLFITIYNLLEDRCGIIFAATGYLEKRIVKGAKMDKKGYREIYSRLGKKFIHIAEVDFTDVVQVCKVNGVEDRMAIKSIFDDSENDLRRVKKKVHAYKKSQQKNN